jgi:hypothetical protein
MKILNFYKFFEASLTKKDLSKPVNNVPGTYRGDILINKIRSGQLIQLDPTKKPGGSVIIDQMLDLSSNKFVDINGPENPLSQITDNTGKYDPVKANPYLNKEVFKATDGRTFRLTHFFKTSQFGSSGAGSTTNENEIIQMALIAIRLELNRDIRKLDVYKYLEEFEEGKFPSNIHIPTGFKVMNRFHFTEDPEWMATFKNSINNIVNAIPGGTNLFNRSIKYDFYQNSDKDQNSIHKVVLNKFKQLAKAENFSQFPSYYKKFIGTDISKYCPADVWAVTSNKDDYNEICSSIKNAVDILDLNRILNAEFDKRNLIPISLKKVGVKKKSGKIIINNELGAEIPKFNIRKFHLESDLEKGMSSKIDTDSIWYPKGETKPITRQRNIRIDSSDSSKFQNVDGEIDGVYARHGKISFLMMKHFIEESTYFKYVLSVVKDNPLQTVEELKSKTVDELTEMIEDTKIQISKFKKPSIEVVFDLKGRNNNLLEKKLISKLQSLQIIRALSIISSYDKSPEKINNKLNPNNEVDKIITKFLLYALSINTGGFSTPRYARVI